MSSRRTASRSHDLIDIDELIDAYYDRKPDAAIPEQRVAFGTSGHRGSSLSTSFNEDHILATTQAIVDYRAAQGIAGPLFLGRDTHALSLPGRAQRDRGARRERRRRARRLPRLVGADAGAQPRDPRLQQGRGADDPGRADGIVVTPSHNPPRDGGFKYNPPHGGPADTDATGWIADRANELIAAGLDGREARARTPTSTATRSATTTSATPTCATSATSSTSRRSSRRACASAPTRSAGHPWSTGR